MTLYPPFLVGFSITITSTASPISLWTILSTPAGSATTGYTIASNAPVYEPGAKPIASLTIQNDPTNANGTLVYLGDSTLTSTNKGFTLAPSNDITFDPGRGSVAWANGIYITASATTTVVNFMVVYG